MILVFGGTTEGRKTIKELEEAGATYFYSTKTGEQEVTLHHGVRTDGAMDREGMITFCREHDIRLLIDASHPFAQQLHQTVADVASVLKLPLIRFDRLFPPRQQDIIWIDDYSQLPQHLGDSKRLLATTGVQSIAKLKPLEAQGITMRYRILPRESSILLAHRQGATDDQLCFYEEQADEKEAMEREHPDAILLKESGLTGGFVEKVEAARTLGIRIIALKRPPYPQSADTRFVNGEHGLRRVVEQLLPTFFPLHSGLTTGTCATAAAIAATLHLLKGERPTEAPVILPNGETIPVPVGFANGYAYVVKDSGDDPDVTKGIEIRATASLRPIAPGDDRITLTAGEGIGRFTLSGFDYPVGEPAINKGPRQMIRQNLEALMAAADMPTDRGLQLLLSIPEGAAIARRTFNPRLGIEGGISIIGVSGIIKPFSEEAFIDSIRKCMEVAKASGTDRVVINSGAKSERFVKALYPDLPPQAFVEYGNYIGETLKIAHELKIPNITLGVMLGKAVKLAEGQLDTHSKKGTMNKDFIGQMLKEAGVSTDAVGLTDITLARELWERLPEARLQAFANVVITHCLTHCQPLLPAGHLTLLLITDEGRIYRLSERKNAHPTC